MRRVFRVTATYTQEGSEPVQVVKHYLSRSGAFRRAALLRAGRESFTVAGISREDPGEYVEAIPPADSVVVEPSDPVTWP